MRNYLDTLLNLHPTEEEQDKLWETPQQQNKMALVDFIGFIVLMAYVIGWCI